MTNQDIQNDIELMKKIVERLKKEKSQKEDWINSEKREKKEQYQDIEMINIWTEQATEMALEIDVLENTIKSLEAELKAKAQR